MKRLLILPVLLLTLLVGNSAFSADFQKGLDAAESGDYATALREWTPLAEQGDANAQYNLGVMSVGYPWNTNIPSNHTNITQYGFGNEPGSINPIVSPTQ